MTTVSIVPIEIANPHLRKFRAVAGLLHSEGSTVGQALDSLTAQLPSENQKTLIVVQYHSADQFFGDHEAQRLADLMLAWRAARDRNELFPEGLQQELDALAERELQAAGNRAAEIAGEVGA